MNIKFPCFSRDVKKSLFASCFLSFIYLFYYFLFYVSCSVPQLRYHLGHRLCCQNQEMPRLQCLVGQIVNNNRACGGGGAKGALAPPLIGKIKENDFLSFH